jgi:hypothetical protein
LVAQLGSQPRLKVLNVALDFGFGSSEALARAFKPPKKTMTALKAL